MVSIGKCLMMTLLLAPCAAEDKAVAKEMPEKPDSVEKAVSSGNDCLDLCCPMRKSIHMAHMILHADWAKLQRVFTSSMAHWR